MSTSSKPNPGFAATVPILPSPPETGSSEAQMLGSESDVPSLAAFRALEARVKAFEAMHAADLEHGAGKTEDFLVPHGMHEGADDAEAVNASTPAAVRSLRMLVKEKTPWKEQQEVQVQGYLVQQKVPVHVPTHGFCLFVYATLLAAYTVVSFYLKLTTPPEMTYSSVESSSFDPVRITLDIECSACVNHTKKGILWSVRYGYADLEHCASAGSGVVTDAPSSEAVLCRSSDDIRDGTGVKVWIGNISAHHVVNGTKVQGRAVVRVSDGADLKVTTPVEHWHEKTLLLGSIVTRDAEDCESPLDCNLQRQLYLASMQYDGKVDWGGETWGGGQVNIRMLRFASVYTAVEAKTWADLLASIGGASGILLLLLGGFRKAIELLVTGSGDRKEAVQTAAVAVINAGNAAQED